MLSQTLKPRRGELENAIYGIANGVDGSLKNLYELCSGAVYAYALTVLKNTYDAQDVMQDTFIKVYDASVNYVPKGKPMSWILAIARNLCFDKFRKQAQQATAFQTEPIDFSSGDPVDRIVVKKCLSELDDDERRIVVMHALGGLKHREIAEELSLPLNTVLSKYKRALGKLKTIIKGGNYD